MQIKKSLPVYDVIIVGSGAAGGVSAHVLVNRGLNVLQLEIGPKWDRTQMFHTEHSWPYELPFRGLGKPGQYDGLWKVSAYTEHLYVHPYVDRYATAAGTDFHWTRIHAVGGRTNTWARVSLRMSEWDFKPKSMQDGVGEDWPISYADLAPYYDRAEDLMGVFGTREGLAVTPDGKYHAPTPRPRCGEVALLKGGRKAGVPIIPIRRAMFMENRETASACHYCGSCDYGCSTASRFSTLDTIVPKLAGRRNYTLRTGAAVHRVLLDERTGKARGVEFVDTRNGRTYEARARVVILGAGAMASTRILLNSTSREMPRGITNSSGVLGHYLMDNFKSGFVSGWFPSLKATEVFNDDGAGGGHLYIPRHTNMPGGRQVGALRGWQFQPATGATRYPGHAKGLTGFGPDFKREVRDQNPARIFLAGFGECLPSFDNYCEIDPGGLKDRYGIPQLRFNAKWGENELKMVDLMYDSAEEILRAAGAEITPYTRVRQPPPPGDATHEVGTARMGDDPRSSVLNRFNQAHDVKNLFVVDGASFVSCPEKNCTLSIAAVSWRASDYVAEEFRRGTF